MFTFLSSSAPEWAQFFSNKEYKKFMSLLHSYFERKGLSYTHKDGIVLLQDNPFGMNQLGLVNLAQQCKLNSDDDWSKIISSHFEGMIAAHSFDKEFETKKHDFSYAKDFIGIRLYHEEYFESVGKENVICKQFSSSILEVLVFDLPHTITNVKPEEIASWNVSVEDLFRIGFENIRDRYPTHVSKEHIGNFDIWFCQGDHLFVTNLALDHDAMKKYIGSKGALVGLPHRHAMMIYPIETLEVATAVNTLIPVIAGMNSEGPGSISSNLFWYIDGTFVILPYELGDKKLLFRPPTEFVEMMNTLR